MNSGNAIETFNFYVGLDLVKFLQTNKFEIQFSSVRSLNLRKRDMNLIDDIWASCIKYDLMRRIERKCWGFGVLRVIAIGFVQYFQCLSITSSADGNGISNVKH